MNDLLSLSARCRFAAGCNPESQRRTLLYVADELHNAASGRLSIPPPPLPFVWNDQPAVEPVRVDPGLAAGIINGATIMLVAVFLASFIYFLA